MSFLSERDLEVLSELAVELSPHLKQAREEIESQFIRIPTGEEFARWLEPQVRSILKVSNEGSVNLVKFYRRADPTEDLESLLNLASLCRVVTRFGLTVSQPTSAS
jgi:hypothetical protein